MTKQIEKKPNWEHPIPVPASKKKESMLTQVLLFPIRVVFLIVRIALLIVLIVALAVALVILLLGLVPLMFLIFLAWVAVRMGL